MIPAKNAVQFTQFACGSMRMGLAYDHMHERETLTTKFHSEEQIDELGSAEVCY
ncbi:hypothetical protein FIBSPDRAFT_855377 [Athelia psychrophila]|uniref:Uncharacterized protein n=1 Tax=Athelia psychrophila TaxID=1759441 RepID=A0A166PGS8_9AGAM|nr:hypothetical protein FIBSPDRAFT_880239 [Fibularhizoctonia sp. CBS 109695]KZP26078.1 hypothetical protein FIBSPDRAFT_855377 [Fibularhizoctonia sp. CBS 109695]